MSYQQAAEWLGISARTLRKIVAEGKIHPAYVYRRVLFTEPMLQEFLEKSARPVTASRRKVPLVRASGRQSVNEIGNREAVVALDGGHRR